MTTPEYLENHNVRLAIIGDTPQKRVSNAAAKLFEEYKEQNGSLESILFNGINYDVVIISNQDKDNKIMYADNSYGIENGDIFDWKNEKWMIIERENKEYTSYNKYTLKRIFFSLKWKTNYNVILEQYAFFIGSSSGNGKDLLEQQKATGSNVIINVADDAMMGTFPINENTLSLTKGQRFIINGQAWKLNVIDNLSSQELLYITFKEDTVNEATDNLILGVADYFLSNWTLVINNEESSINTVVGRNVTIRTTVYKDTEPITAAITWSSSNEEIATVVSGIVTPIATGNVVITAALVSNPTIKSTISVKIESVLVPVTNYEIWGNSKLKVGGDTITLVGKKIVSGEEYAQTFIFTIDNNLVSVVSSTNSSITLKSNVKNKLGKTIISAYIDSTLVATKEIEIVSMFIKVGEE